MQQGKFVANNLVVDAVERCVAAEDLAPGQPWAKIRGLGNLLRHEYDTIRRSVLWEIVTEDLSSLEIACKKALAKLADKDKRKS